MRDRDLLKALAACAAILGALLLLIAHFQVAAIPADPFCSQAIGKVDLSLSVDARGGWGWSFSTGSICEHYRPVEPGQNTARPYPEP